MSSPPGNIFYDAERQIISGGGVNYTYDGNRMRVKKSSGTLYWRDTSGNTIAETNLSGTTTNEYVFFGGRRVIRHDPSGNLFLSLADQIGSTRSITEVTTSGSASLCYDADFSPYGSEIAHTTSCSPNYKFTGYERDTETGLDYAINRYFDYRNGRFMSPDPLGTASVDNTNPQSSNRYTYVANNPTIFIDSTGTDIDLCSMSGVQIDPNVAIYCSLWAYGITTLQGLPSYFSAAYAGPPPTLSMGCITSFGGEGGISGGGGCPTGGLNSPSKVGYQGGDATTIPDSYFQMVSEAFGDDSTLTLAKMGLVKAVPNGHGAEYDDWLALYKDLGIDYQGADFQTPTPMAIPPHPTGCSLLTGEVVQDIIGGEPVPPNLTMAMKLVCHIH